MLNKKLLLGSLAGATLMVGGLIMMPGIAQAGLVTGSCVNCHTMHNSDDGNTMSAGTAAGAGAAKRLLREDCVGCHTTRENDAATGRASADPKAPQVTSSLGGNAAGYFNVDSARAHNEKTLDDASWFTTGTALSTAPGGATVTAAMLTCESCHKGASGSHHKSTGAGTAKDGSKAEESYRMLGIDATIATGATGSSAYIKTNGNPDHNYNDGADSYVASGVNGMNEFCASCHSLFHGDANTSFNNDGATPWIRHPTDIAIGTYGASYADSADAKIPTGTNGSTTTSDVVMCISCHRAHGSSEVDMLRFSYNKNIAGDATKETGCETCHGIK